MCVDKNDPSVNMVRVESGRSGGGVFTYTLPVSSLYPSSHFSLPPFPPSLPSLLPPSLLPPPSLPPSSLPPFLPPSSLPPFLPFSLKIIRSMAVFAMKPAEYVCTGTLSPEEFAHYGLGLDFYTHFTSPIRRYADVVVCLILWAHAQHTYVHTHAHTHTHTLTHTHGHLHAYTHTHIYTLHI